MEDLWQIEKAKDRKRERVGEVGMRQRTGEMARVGRERKRETEREGEEDFHIFKTYFTRVKLGGCNIL